ncbi:hypothetical protein D3C72_1972690 [compost metagenome]
MLPPGGFGHPENVGFFVVVAVFQLGRYVGGVGVAVEVFVVGVCQAQHQRGVVGGKGVRDVFDEDEAEH